MTITSEKIDKVTAVLSLDGRLDTANAPLLEQKIKQWGDDIQTLILDFAELHYISSMGLRVLLQTKKECNHTGRKLIIKNMADSIREVFEMTGFLNLMVQEEKFVVIRKHEGDSVVLSLNGQMQSEHAAMIVRELTEIKDTCLARAKPVTVYLDMERLTHITPEAAACLNSVIEETAWVDRKLLARNASVDMAAELKERGLGYIL